MARGLPSLMAIFSLQREGLIGLQLLSAYCLAGSGANYSALALVSPQRSLPPPKLPLSPHRGPLKTSRPPGPRSSGQFRRAEEGQSMYMVHS